MKWITSISINNYRAFPSAYKIVEIPTNHHVLIYGENGSGKTSVYQAVKDFFNSSANISQGYELNLFSKNTGNNTGSITIEISELDANGNLISKNTYAFGNPDNLSTHRISTVQLANKVKGFIDYKRLLKTHFIETKPGQNPNLFKLVIENLLSDHLIKKPVGGGVSDFPLSDQWERIKKDILFKDLRYNAHIRALAELPAFEASLRQLLIMVFTEFKRLIQTYFDKKLEINVNLSKIEFDRKKWKIKEELFLEIKYAGEEITSYHTFINEARLSALGICIYLAAIKTYPPDASELKILYLDDVFIGLDTGNRLPLLKLLKNEFVNKGYQFFISTYDRQWFETARTWLQQEKCELKCLELYVNDSDGNPTTADIPVIIDPSLCFYDKAKHHFEHKDYPAAANYLRKTCENEIKRILPRNMVLRADNVTGEIKKIETLDALIDKFFQFLTKNNIDQAAFLHFKTYKKILLNPLSHDDLESPHYRQEIIDGINIVNELQKIKSKEIIKALESNANPMKLSINDNTTSKVYDYEIIVLENLQIIQVDANPIFLSTVECQVKETTIRPFKSLYKAFDQIWQERNHPNPVNYGDFLNRIRTSPTYNLIDIMTF